MTDVRIREEAQMRSDDGISHPYGLNYPANPLAANPAPKRPLFAPSPYYRAPPTIRSVCHSQSDRGTMCLLPSSLSPLSTLPPTAMRRRPAKPEMRKPLLSAPLMGKIPFPTRDWHLWNASMTWRNMLKMLPISPIWHPPFWSKVDEISRNWLEIRGTSYPKILCNTTQASLALHVQEFC